MQPKKLTLLFLAIGIFQCYQATGQKLKNLRNTTILNMRLEYDKQVLKIKGSHIPIGISVIVSDNSRHTTKGFSKGNLRWSNFKISVDGAKYSNGKITIPSNRDVPQAIAITVTSKYNPKQTLKDVIILNKLTDIKILPVVTGSVSPGNKFRVGGKATFDNGTINNYESLNSSVLRLLDLRIKISGGEISNGTVHLSDNIDDFPDHSVYINAFSNKNNSVADSLKVMLDYKKNYYFVESGFSGLSGFSGNKGSDGSSGKNGCTGNEGDDGKNGDDGDDLDVFADAYFDSILLTNLIYVEIYNLKWLTTKKFLINPDGGSIYIESSGGDGGNGGSGGNGGNGGNGEPGEKFVKEIKDSTCTRTIVTYGPGCNGGDAGDGGDGGYGGNGGYGGSIFVHYTAAAKPYLQLIKVKSEGGDYGKGGSGGNSGTPGTGGAGDPNGTNGRSGNSGHRGYDGYPGDSGDVRYEEVTIK